MFTIPFKHLISPFLLLFFWKRKKWHNFTKASKKHFTLLLCANCQNSFRAIAIIVKGNKRCILITFSYTDRAWETAPLLPLPPIAQLNAYFTRLGQRMSKPPRLRAAWLKATPTGTYRLWKQKKNKIKMRAHCFRNRLFYCAHTTIFLLSIELKHTARFFFPFCFFWS